MLSKFTDVLFQGKKIEVWVNTKQTAKWLWKAGLGRFEINQDTASDKTSFLSSYSDYCSNELRKIIDRQIAVLRQKKIDVPIPHTDGKTTFNKNLHISVDDYLKMIGFNTKIDYKIGQYEKEWGINELDNKKKTFVLHFNYKMIYFDNGEKIKYVVAHELTHVFHRDHGNEFQQTLERLYPEKRQAEYFFNWGIASKFGNQSYSFQYFILIIIALGLIFWLGSYIWDYFQKIFFRSEANFF
jgi:hypothetical protein